MSLLDALLLDPYPINIWIANRTDSVKGSGTQNDPYDGSTSAKLDSLLNRLAPNTRVHLGPGMFQTQGYFDGTTGGTGWQPKTGMKIVGSGVGVTTLQVANTAATNQHVFAIGHALYSAGPLVTAVTPTGMPRNDFPGWVGFGFLVGAAPITVTDLGRWIVSGNNQSHTVQLFNMDNSAVPGGSVTLNTAGQPAGQFAYATLPALVTLLPNSTYYLMSLEANGGDQWYDFSGAVITVSTLVTLPAAVFSYLNPFSIVGVPSNANKSYGPVSLRYNAMSADFFEVSDLTIDCNLSGQSGAQVAVGAVRILGNHSRVARVELIKWGTKSVSRPCYVVALLTADPASGFTGVADCGIEDCIAITPGGGNAGPVTLFHAGGNEAAATNVNGFGVGPYIRNCFADGGQTSPFPNEIRGLSMAWCKGGVVEGNQVHNMMHGGPFQQPSSAQDLVVRNNFYKNVNKGPFLGGIAVSQGTGSLSRSGVVATVTLPSGHTLLAGDYVLINTSPMTVFDGIVVTLTGTTSTTFTFNTSITSASSATVSSVKKVFGISNLVLEGNTVELAPAIIGATEEVIGIHAQDWASATATQDQTYPTCVFGKVIVRDNKIRYVDGAYASNYKGFGIQMNSASNLLVRNNVVECAPLNPLRSNRCGAVKCFNDKTPAGTLIQGWNESVSKKYDELETDAEDALVLALFNRR